VKSIKIQNLEPLPVIEPLSRSLHGYQADIHCRFGICHFHRGARSDASYYYSKCLDFHANSDEKDLLIKFLPAYIFFILGNFHGLGNIGKLLNFHVQTAAEYQTAEYLSMILTEYADHLVKRGKHLDLAKDFASRALKINRREHKTKLLTVWAALYHFEKDIKRSYKFCLLAIKHTKPNSVRHSEAMAFAKRLRPYFHKQDKYSEFVDREITANQQKFRELPKLDSEHRVLIRALVFKRNCAVCGTAKGLTHCSGCKQVRYCSVAHQNEHWPQHQLECRNAE